MIECLLFGQALGASLCADCVGSLCAAASQTPPAATAAHGREMTVTSSTRALLPEEGLWAQLASIQDNRCAVEVKCVWAGYAVVTFRVGTGSEAPATVVIGDPHPGAPAVATYGPYRFELVGLEPPNSMTKPPPLSSYRARLHVTKGPG